MLHWFGPWGEGSAVLGVLRRMLNANERDIRRLREVAREITALEPEMEKQSDADLAHQTVVFKERLERGEALDDLLVEAFAVVREASRRVLGQRPFDVQLMGGVVLHEGRIAEMKTGEGKTLVATLPSYLNALTGKGVHVVTVNDYLAKRDSQWMGQIHRFLGLRVGVILQGLDSAARRYNYAADITYGTNSEFGFDYLRDNMALDQADLAQRGLHFAIIDEVDSILIDEARTPLIISDVVEKPRELFYRFAKVAEQLVAEEDYTVDEKLKTVAPTEAGVHKVEQALNVENLFDVQNMNLSHYLDNSLKAKALFHRDRDYIVKDGEVILVDEFTGRLMFGRRYGHGLHEAIEAKEGCKIPQGTQTMATITYQNYFRLYEKLAGMTGTAATEEQEFQKIYKLDVVVIPTNLPMIRKDFPDLIYKTAAGKFRAVVSEIEECHRRGQPVLVGTVDIAKSERLASMLEKAGIPHQVLNAKHHEREAEIVAQAGREGAVTIATNMAGRGTDILLGGNPEFLARHQMRQEGTLPELIEVAAEKVPPDRDELAARMGDQWNESIDIDALRAHYVDLVASFRAQTERERQRVINAGGLHIIGTERHESRRIDNQLRGRSGRQGDPGSSHFYLSLEDDLMRLFGPDRIRGLMERLGFSEDEPIEHPWVTNAIEKAQRTVEGRNFDARKHVLDYDDVMNQQRTVFYRQRHDILTSDDCHPFVEGMLADLVHDLVAAHCPENADPEEWDFPGLIQGCEQFFCDPGMLSADALPLGRDALSQQLLDVAAAAYAKRQSLLTPEYMRVLERQTLLRIINSQWIDHLEAMDDLQEGIGLRAYGQLDPLAQYRIEAYDLFQDLVRHIREDVVRAIYHMQVVVQYTPEQQAQLERQWEMARRMVAQMAAGGAPRGTVAPVATPVATPVGQTPPKSASAPAPGPAATAPVRRVGRNDPCPCGSGKKYKHCHGR